MIVTNSTISGNTADRDGGGIFYGGGVITLNHATVTNNTADNDYPANNVGDGGGIYGASQGSRINLNNTIVAGNTDKDNGDAGSVTFAPDCVRIVSTIYSLIGIGDACSPSFPDINLIGSATSPIDPKLSPLAGNGGFGRTHTLQSGSPAVDAGSTATQGNSVCASTDQRGFLRPKDGDANGTARCDIGALEVGCGDSIVQSGAAEECDDGNTTNTDSCTNSCQNARCGDEIVGPGEGCDDANTVATDSCTNSCQLAKCSDGIIGPNEECDDSNTTNGDGCDSSCKKEASTVEGGGSSGGAGSGSTTPGGTSTAETPATDPSASPTTSGGGCTLLVR